MKHLRKALTLSATILSLFAAMPGIVNAQMSSVKTVWVILMENHNWSRAADDINPGCRNAKHRRGLQRRCVVCGQHFDDLEAGGEEGLHRNVADQLAESIQRGASSYIFRDRCLQRRDTDGDDHFQRRNQRAGDCPAEQWSGLLYNQRIAKGTHKITAAYGATTNYNASSATLSEIVN